MFGRCRRGQYQQGPNVLVQIDIFEKDIVVFPINLRNVHWICGAINFKDKRFECYDSMKPNGHAEVYEVGYPSSCSCALYRAARLIASHFRTLYSDSGDISLLSI